jgi:hypothetical protein
MPMSRPSFASAYNIRLRLAALRFNTESSIDQICDPPAKRAVWRVTDMNARQEFQLVSTQRLIAFVVSLAMFIVIPSAASAATTHASGSGLPPLPVALPGNTVALVSHVPTGLGTITKQEFHRALIQQVAASGRNSVPKPGQKGYEQLRVAVVGERLDAVWIQGQAVEMGLLVTNRQISRELREIKKQNFKSNADYRRFLKDSHFTVQDVRERVKLQMLSVLVQEKVGRNAKAFKQFVAAYSKRWRARTVCAPEFVIDRCSNGPVPPAPRVAGLTQSVWR